MGGFRGWEREGVILLKWRFCPGPCQTFRFIPLWRRVVLLCVWPTNGMRELAERKVCSLTAGADRDLRTHEGHVVGQE